MTYVNKQAKTYMFYVRLFFGMWVGKQLPTYLNMWRFFIILFQQETRGDTCFLWGLDLTAYGPSSVTSICNVMNTLGIE